VLDEGLTWPPTREDLERLYIVEKLSAAKIAKAYGLRYKDLKVAESAILYHLKRNGIKRRDPADHVRKVTEEMVDAWVRRYEAGESLKQIAGCVLSPVTVMTHLNAGKVQLRSRLGAQITAVSKHLRRPFSGSKEDQSYLIGFARGNLYVSRHGRAIRIKTATTHPMMIEHLRQLFGQFGHCLVSPRKSALAGFEWSFQVDLDKSFSFLLEFRRSLPRWILRRRCFLSFLAGFFDAEGSIVLNESSFFGFQISITNTDTPLLEAIRARMGRLGFDFHLYWGKNGVCRLQLWKPDKVEELLGLLPLRHPEKVSKASIAYSRRKAISAGSYDGMVAQWDSLIRSIKSGRDEFVRQAKEAIEGAAGK